MSVIALIDCNNFYVSCERAFDPSLKNRPVVILSNNDGCVIACSEDLKKLNIAFQPFFKIRDLCNQLNVAVFSSNYTLYGDLSARIMSILKDLDAKVEVYSIDEAFLKLNLNGKDPYIYALNLQNKILQYTGIPVSIGIAPSKTLAKIATSIAKKNPHKVFCLLDENLKNNILKNMPIEKIWGIGKNWAYKLRKLGIGTALDLKNIENNFARKYLNVIGLKLSSELKGIACLDFEEFTSSKKNIISSRSFGYSISNKNKIEEALCEYTARACVKLRSQNSLANGIVVFIKTNRFKNNIKQYQNSYSLNLDMASSDTSYISKYAKKCFDKIYDDNYSYHKAGIILLGLVPNNYNQINFIDGLMSSKKGDLMSAMDSLNKKYGTNFLKLANQGCKQEWKMKRSFCSPNYTTNWQDLPLCK